MQSCSRGMKSYFYAIKQIGTLFSGAYDLRTYSKIHELKSVRGFYKYCHRAGYLVCSNLHLLILNAVFDQIAEAGIDTYLIVREKHILPRLAAVFSIPVSDSLAEHLGGLGFLNDRFACQFVVCLGFNHINHICRFNNKVRLISVNPAWTIVDIELLCRRSHPFQYGFIIFEYYGKITLCSAVKFV